MTREKITLAIRQVEFARSYTKTLLDGIAMDDWFLVPSGSPTHLAWQVGHLAMAEYALTMLRIRGKEHEDEAWMPKAFFRQFQKGTVPTHAMADYPDIAQILKTFDEVHERALLELSRYHDEELSESLPAPYALFPTKLGSIFFSSSHEMIHAGQIGLIRRLLGKPPVR